MTVYWSTKAFSGVFHVYQLLLFPPPPPSICVGNPELSCWIAVICFVSMLIRISLKLSSSPDLIWNTSCTFSPLFHTFYNVTGIMNEWEYCRILCFLFELRARQFESTHRFGLLQSNLVLQTWWIQGDPTYLGKYSKLQYNSINACAHTHTHTHTQNPLSVLLYCRICTSICATVVTMSKCWALPSHVLMRLSMEQCCWLILKKSTSLRKLPSLREMLTMDCHL